MKRLRHLLAETTGTSAIEYACIAALIAAGSLIGVQSLGAEVGNSYTTTAQEIKDATP